MFGVYASLLFLFFTFALNMVLQYLQAGPWKRSYFSECIYLWLSVAAKSILAWQIYAGSTAVYAQHRDTIGLVGVVIMSNRLSISSGVLIQGINGRCIRCRISGSRSGIS